MEKRRTGRSDQNQESEDGHRERRRVARLGQAKVKTGDSTIRKRAMVIRRLQAMMGDGSDGTIRLRRARPVRGETT